MTILTKKGRLVVVKKPRKIKQYKWGAELGRDIGTGVAAVGQVLQSIADKDREVVSLEDKLGLAYGGGLNRYVDGGDIMGAVGSGAELLGNAVGQAQTDYSDDDVNSASAKAATRNIETSSTFDELETAMSNYTDARTNFTARDMRDKSVFSDFSNSLAASGKGFAAGSSFGPWGAAIGGVVGGVSSVIGSLFGRNKAKKQARQLNAAAKLGNERAHEQFALSADQIAENVRDEQLRSFIAAMGGSLRRNKKAAGGPLKDVSGPLMDIPTPLGDFGSPLGDTPAPLPGLKMKLQATKDKSFNIVNGPWGMEMYALGGPLSPGVVKNRLNATETGRGLNAFGEGGSKKTKAQQEDEAKMAWSKDMYARIKTHLKDIHPDMSNEQNARLANFMLKQMANESFYGLKTPATNNYGGHQLNNEWLSYPSVDEFVKAHISLLDKKWPEYARALNEMEFAAALLPEDEGREQYVGYDDRGGRANYGKNMTDMKSVDKWIDFAKDYQEALFRDKEAERQAAIFGPRYARDFPYMTQGLVEESGTLVPDNTAVARTAVPLHVDRAENPSFWAPSFLPPSQMLQSLPVALPGGRLQDVWNFDDGGPTNKKRNIKTVKSGARQSVLSEEEKAAAGISGNEGAYIAAADATKVKPRINYTKKKGLSPIASKVVMKSLQAHSGEMTPEVVEGSAVVDGGAYNAAQDTYLTGRADQRKHMEKHGYKFIEPTGDIVSDYGPVRTNAYTLGKAKGEAMPIYALGDTAKNGLVNIGSEVVYRNRQAHTGSAPLVYYADPKTGKVFFEEWDLNNYGHSLSKYGYDDIFLANTDKLGEVLDMVGSPIVYRSGIRPIKKGKDTLTIADIAENGLSYDSDIIPLSIYRKARTLSKNGMSGYWNIEHDNARINKKERERFRRMEEEYKKEHPNPFFKPQYNPRDTINKYMGHSPYRWSANKFLDIMGYADGGTISRLTKGMNSFDEGGEFDKWALPKEVAKGIFQIIDPTGISSYGDVYDAYKAARQDPSIANIGNLAFETLGALPLIGKFATPIKLYKGVKKIEKVSKALKRLEALDKAVSLPILKEGIKLPTSWRPGDYYGTLKANTGISLLNSGNMLQDAYNMQENVRNAPRAFGGELNTQGANFKNGLLEINNGGTHESNKYEGVPMGRDMEGTPNVVEEGETIYDDYVYSNRIKIPDMLKKKYKLGGKKGMTFADASKRMARESSERPNDPISSLGLEVAMNELRQQQDMVKQARELGRMQAEQDIMHSMGLPTPEELGVAQQQQDTINAQMAQRQAMQAAPMADPQQAMIQGFGLGGVVNKFSGDDETHQSSDLKDPGTAVKDIPAMFPPLSDSARMFPLYASGAQVLTDALGLTNKPDYAEANMIRQASDSTYLPVRAGTLGSRLTFKPFDRNWALNEQRAANAANMGAIRGNAGLNRGIASNALLANNANYTNGIGQIMKSAEEYNRDTREKVATFNRSTDSENIRNAMTAATANQNAFAQARQRYLSGMTAAAEAHQRERNAVDEAKAQNMTNFISSMGEYGKDNMNYNKTLGAIIGGAFGPITPEVASLLLGRAPVSTTKSKKLGGKLKRKARKWL